LSELRSFTDQVVASLSRDGQDEIIEEDELEPEDDEVEEGAETSETADDALAAAFWESLDPASRDAAEQDEDVREELWRAFLEAEQGLEASDAEDEPADDSDEIRSAQDFVAGVLNGEIPAIDDDGRQVDPVAYLMALATCSPAEWRAAANAVGWPVDQRPTRWMIASMSRGAEAEVRRLDWETNLAKARERGRFLGQ
jgi:hypothetical protein